MARDPYSPNGAVSMELHQLCYLPMKRIYLLAVLCSAVFSLQAQTFSATDQNGKKSSKNAPNIKFDVTVNNFGIFDITDGFQECYFKFTNTGKEDLVIIQCAASCGCTVPEWPKDPIKPGARDSIKVVYDGTSRRPGTFRKVITVKTNAKTENSYIYIQGEMVDTATTARITKELDSLYKK